MNIETARDGDDDALLALRNHDIAHPVATFDEAPLHPAAVREWIAGFGATAPHRLLVARDGGRLLGYCSSQPCRTHLAFARTVETSVCVAPDAARAGVGAALYARLFADLAGAGWHRAVVGIAWPNEASIRLHARFGFRPVGVFDEYAHKNGRATSSQWMERHARRIRVSRFVGAIVCTVLAAALGGCASGPAFPCAHGQQPMRSELLYFGTAMPQGSVSAEDWRGFVDEIVTPRFPDGLTAWPANGQWRSSQGALVREASWVISVVHRPDAASETAITAIVEGYKTRFHQESVLRVTSEACVAF